MYAVMVIKVAKVVKVTELVHSLLFSFFTSVKCCEVHYDIYASFSA